ncbi:hypothetical protein V8E36_006700 [Tilletia maclaganii]
MAPAASSSSSSVPGATAAATGAVLRPYTAAELQVAMSQSILRTHDRHTAVRPQNTTRNYEPKQKEWREWCEEKGFDEMSRTQVTAEKLHLFLEKCVLHGTPMTKATEEVFEREYISVGVHAQDSVRQHSPPLRRRHH